MGTVFQGWVVLVLCALLGSVVQGDELAEVAAAISEARGGLADLGSDLSTDHHRWAGRLLVASARLEEAFAQFPPSLPEERLRTLIDDAKLAYQGYELEQQLAQGAREKDPGSDWQQVGAAIAFRLNQARTGVEVNVLGDAVAAWEAWERLAKRLQTSDFQGLATADWQAAIAYCRDVAMGQAAGREKRYLRRAAWAEATGAMAVSLAGYEDSLSRVPAAVDHRDRLLEVFRDLRADSLARLRQAWLGDNDETAKMAERVHGKFKLSLIFFELVCRRSLVLHGGEEARARYEVATWDGLSLSNVDHALAAAMLAALADDRSAASQVTLLAKVSQALNRLSDWNVSHPSFGEGTWLADWTAALKEAYAAVTRTMPAGELAGREEKLDAFAAVGMSRLDARGAREKLDACRSLARPESIAPLSDLVDRHAILTSAMLTALPEAVRNRETREAVTEMASVARETAYPGTVGLESLSWLKEMKDRGHRPGSSPWYDGMAEQLVAARNGSAVLQSLGSYREKIEAVEDGDLPMEKFVPEAAGIRDTIQLRMANASGIRTAQRLHGEVDSMAAWLDQAGPEVRKRYFAPMQAKASQARGLVTSAAQQFGSGERDQGQAFLQTANRVLTEAAQASRDGLKKWKAEYEEGIRRLEVEKKKLSDRLRAMRAAVVGTPPPLMESDHRGEIAGRIDRLLVKIAALGKSGKGAEIAQELDSLHEDSTRYVIKRIFHQMDLEIEAFLRDAPTMPVKKAVRETLVTNVMQARLFLQQWRNFLWKKDPAAATARKNLLQHDYVYNAVGEALQYLMEITDPTVSHQALAAMDQAFAVVNDPTVEVKRALNISLDRVRTTINDHSYRQYLKQALLERLQITFSVVGIVLVLVPEPTQVTKVAALACFAAATGIAAYQTLDRIAAKGWKVGVEDVPGIVSTVLGAVMVGQMAIPVLRSVSALSDSSLLARAAGVAENPLFIQALSGAVIGTCGTGLIVHASELIHGGWQTGNRSQLLASSAFELAMVALAIASLSSAGAAGETAGRPAEGSGEVLSSRFCFREMSSHVASSVAGLNIGARLSALAKRLSSWRLMEKTATTSSEAPPDAAPTVPALAGGPSPGTTTAAPPVKPPSFRQISEAVNRMHREAGGTLCVKDGKTVATLRVKGEDGLTYEVRMNFEARMQAGREGYAYRVESVQKVSEATGKTDGTELVDPACGTMSGAQSLPGLKRFLDWHDRFLSPQIFHRFTKAIAKRELFGAAKDRGYYIHYPEAMFRYIRLYPMKAVSRVTVFSLSFSVLTAVFNTIISPISELLKQTLTWGWHDLLGLANKVTCGHVISEQYLLSLKVSGKSSFDQLTRDVQWTIRVMLFAQFTAMFSKIWNVDIMYATILDPDHPKAEQERFVMCEASLMNQYHTIEELCQLTAQYVYEFNERGKEAVNIFNELAEFFVRTFKADLHQDKVALVERLRKQYSRPGSKYDAYPINLKDFSITLTQGPDRTIICDFSGIRGQWGPKEECTFRTNNGKVLPAWEQLENSYFDRVAATAGDPLSRAVARKKLENPVARSQFRPKLDGNLNRTVNPIGRKVMSDLYDGGGRPFYLEDSRSAVPEGLRSRLPSGS